ncbi:hypothetical protein DFR52_1171 [Hoeflea marina]|uniref:ATP-grasp domain-containing protein n=2 Tax=Hoeflea marina TaxID=274592 RepID=A0A317PHB4_9HYPH|nr:hypothetical protein [Hoeflea marina]PWV94434.1 hypothetical protein DFR52_1171 [Hoeflea marina]
MSASEKLSNSLSGNIVFLAANQPDGFPSSLYYNIYPSAVIEGYRTALEELGATVITCTLGQALERFSKFQKFEGFSIVNICIAFNALECEGIIQAVAALSSVPCFPCRGDIAVITEEKIISKHLAAASGFLVVDTYHSLDALEVGKRYIRKLINSGDSKGLRIIEDIKNESPLSEREFAEPFVRGLDIELYCIFDPIEKKSVLLNTRVADWGKLNGTDFIHSSEMKPSSDIYQKGNEPVFRWKKIKVTREIEECVERLGVLLHNTFIFRIDGRLAPNAEVNEPIALEQFTFLEVNALPTIPGDDGWYSPRLIKIAGLSDNDPHAENQPGSAELALKLLLSIWHKYYVQSKSADGNIPLL